MQKNKSLAVILLFLVFLSLFCIYFFSYETSSSLTGTWSSEASKDNTAGSAIIFSENGTAAFIDESGVTAVKWSPINMNTLSIKITGTDGLTSLPAEYSYTLETDTLILNGQTYTRN